MYSLIGVDGNAFALIAYTSHALKCEGLHDLVDEMRDKAMSGDYYNLIRVCDEYVAIANKKAFGVDVADVDDDYVEEV